MATYRQIVYMILDELKVVSDDSHFTQEHILFLIDNYRAFFIRKDYEEGRLDLSDINYQTICVDLYEDQGIDMDECSGVYLKSIQKIPELLGLGVPKPSTLDYFQGYMTYVNRERFKYVGNNKYLRNIIYVTLGPDNHLYLKSVNPQFYYLRRMKFTAVFEDSEKAAELSCEKNDDSCDILDKEFPLEERLIPLLIDAVVKELSAAVTSPADEQNNATDDLQGLALHLANIRQKLKSKS